ncbi:MAG: hypothetical protein QOG62_983 [Thermoleophilaceae bacterium]|jgi:hypothetical protein|nr:hypothetical protein [Thermoleophilaceae bacterium]
MPDVLSPQVPGLPESFLPRTIEVDERAAKESLRNQIARLESELSALCCSTFPRLGFDWSAGSRRGGPRLLSLRDLELVRDDLVERLHRNRKAIGLRSLEEQEKRRLIEAMLLAPEEHRGARVRSYEIGERSCKTWEVRPRWGPIGLLMNWWRVVISSGCPLAQGRGLRPRPRSHPTGS